MAKATEPEKKKPRLASERDEEPPCSALKRKKVVEEASEQDEEPPRSALKRNMVAEETPLFFLERDEAPACSGHGKEAEGPEEAPLFIGKEAEEAVPCPRTKKRGPADASTSTTQNQATENAAFAAAALLPYDPTSRKRKKYKAWQTQLRQAIGRYFPDEPMKISHQSTFRQIAVRVQNMRGTSIDLANVTGEEGIRQVLPAGTNLGRGVTAVYRGVVEFLISSPNTGAQ